MLIKLTIIISLTLLALWYIRKPVVKAMRRFTFLRGGEAIPSVAPNDVESWLKSGNVLFVFASWCGFCKQMKPDVAAAASKCKIAQIDGHVYSEALSSVHNFPKMEGFPMLVKYADSRYISLVGKQDFGAIQKFCGL